MVQTWLLDFLGTIGLAPTAHADQAFLCVGTRLGPGVVSAFGDLVQERSTLACQETFRDSGNKLGRGVQMSGNLGVIVLTSVPSALTSRVTWNF